MTKREKNKLMADRMGRSAIRTYNRNVKLWKNESDMMEMVNGDLADHQRIAKLIREGKLEKAAWAVQDLDTSSREDVPDTVYYFLLREIE